MSECGDCGGALPVALTFDSEAYRQASALAAAFAYGDADATREILEDAGRDLACAMTIMLHAALLRFEELGDGCIEEQLEALGRASLIAAQEERDR